MEIEKYYYSLSGVTEAYSRQHKFPLAPNVPVDEFIRQAVLGYIDILDYINFKEIQGPFTKDPDILPTHTVFYRDQNKLDRFYFNKEQDSIIIEWLTHKINSEHMFYLEVIKILSMFIRGKYQDIKKHPILKSSVSETTLRGVLKSQLLDGLSDTSLQKIFTAANNNRRAKEVSDNTLLLCIAEMYQIILHGYHKSGKHPSVMSEEDLENKLYILEPSLNGRCLKSFFGMAVKAREQKLSD